MTPDAQLNRPVGSPLAPHKRQIYLGDSIAEAFGIKHTFSNLT